MVGLDDLSGLSNLHDPMILCYGDPDTLGKLGKSVYRGGLHVAPATAQRSEQTIREASCYNLQLLSHNT